MPLCLHASILLPMLIACGVVAQEAQPTPTHSRDSRIYHIYLAGTPGKPVSIRASVEHIEAMEGTKVVSKHWVEEWVRGSDGRVWGRVRAPQEDHPEKLPPLVAVWLFDTAARETTFCSIADKECRVNGYDPPSPISFLHIGGSSQVCIDSVCQVPEQHERVWCGDERFEQTFLGEHSIGGVTLRHIRMMCYKPDGSGGGVDLWHNSDFDIDFDVYDMPLQEGMTYYRIDQISSSVPDAAEFFAVPPRGYSFKYE